MHDVMTHIYNKLERTDFAANFTDYIEKSHALKNLDDLYDETAIDIGEFWKHWASIDVNISKVFKKGRLISKTVSKITILEK